MQQNKSSQEPQNLNFCRKISSHNITDTRACEHIVKYKYRSTNVLMYVVGGVSKTH